jgi:DNA-directed RNA polymerase specialized sigma24 family protein
MGRANAATRRKRQQRRQGLEQANRNGAHSNDLVPHTPTCPCAACEERRKKILQAGIEGTRKRRRHYAPGHEHPEHREGWCISPHHLSAFMVTHESERDRKGRRTHVDMRPRWLDHLDGLVVQQALAQMQECRPYWVWLITCCVLDGHTQTQVAEWLGVNPSTISRQLGGALRHLRDLLCPHRDRDQAGGAA